MSGPRVSVLMPVYNADRYLREAVDSVFAQLYSAFELVAVDDGSTDSSADMLREYAAEDNRMVVLSRRNTGIVGALNDGLAECRGEFVARMDADDISLVTRFASQVEFLEHHPDCVLVGSPVITMDEHGHDLFVAQTPLRHEVILDHLLHGNVGLWHPSVMMRRSALVQVGGYREKYQWSEDRDLWLRIVDCGSLANLSTPLLRYRTHSQSVCNQRQEQQALNRRRIVEEYFRRRGESLPGDWLIRDRVIPSRANVHRQAAWQALARSRRVNAVGHACAAVLFSLLDVVRVLVGCCRR